MLYLSRLLSILLLILLLTFGISCKKNNTEDNSKDDSIDTLYIYSINDFHGALQSSNGKYGASRTASFIKDSIAGKEDQCLIISAGDMFQGTAISNYSYGSSVIDFMNYVEFDCMTIGNHEFDWSLSKILTYVDGDKSNGEANFPFLACNLVNASTLEIPNFLKPYTIIEKSGITIGIIGYLGANLAEDISESEFEGYSITNPVTSVSYYASYLRTTMNCSVVIAVGHDGTSSTNNMIMSLSDDNKVDAIINGHSHARYNKQTKRLDGSTISCIQSGSSGEYVGVTTITIDKETKKAVTSTAVNKQMNDKISEDSYIKQYVDNLTNELSPLFGRVLCTCGKTFTRTEVVDWASKQLLNKYDADFSFVNVGCIREDAFPVNENDVIDVEKVYELSPFDNLIVTEKLLGKIIKNLIVDKSLNVSTKIDNIDDDTLYDVVVIDFLFNKSNYPFKDGEDIVKTDTLFRNVLIEAFEKIGNNSMKWE